MLVRRIAVENVRSFLTRAELKTDGPISILIGPNGGGKTNLLDIIVIILRRYLLASMYAVHVPSPEQPDRHEFRQNDALNNMILEKHSQGASLPQMVEIEVELTDSDANNIRLIQSDAPKLLELATKKYHNAQLLQRASAWKVDALRAGDRMVYRWNGGSLAADEANPSAREFLEYLQIFEIDSLIRDENQMASLSTPLVYLPVNRSANGFASHVQLANYNSAEQKRQNDAVFSRTGLSIIQMAIGRLAQKYRLLLEQDKGVAASQFKSDANLVELTRLLGQLGYEWELASVNPLRNEYDVRLKKQGTSFLVGSASSGEKEILTYLFAIYALNIRDAIIVVDEPELHLHPKWQTILLKLFEQLVASTGNQFLLATHSPMFVSPESIQYVSRVYSRKQESNILRLDASALPNRRHLFNVVNSQNNERIFFADWVILVEGISDRIFFEAVLRKMRISESIQATVEIVSVGGKGLFPAYQSLLRACHIEHFVIADSDYIEQVGNGDVKALFSIDAAEIKRDVIENVKSMDGALLVERIDRAISEGSWGDAKDVWEYIKSRRRRLKASLAEAERSTLERFFEEMRVERIFILKRGALEDYLPDGFRSKDLEKLIEFLATDAFWDRLLPDGRNEIVEIVDQMINVIKSDSPGAAALAEV
jgi:putative ATP-dependent endonuclease of OLD family